MSGDGLILSGIEKSFVVDGNVVEVLHNIDLVVPSGAFVSIVGPSGCGKSTLLRLLAGLDKDYHGQITLDREPIVGPSLDRGIVFQDHRLFPWLTVERNVSMAFQASDVPAAERTRLVAEHIAMVGLRGFERAYPSQLSGGMAQRAAIARAMVNSPRTLLLDEPLGALDFFTRLRLQDELQDLWMKRHVTMILVTHDIDEAVYLSDKVVVLKPNPGRVDRIFDVAVARPRRRDSEDLAAIRKDVLATFA